MFPFIQVLSGTGTIGSLWNSLRPTADQSTQTAPSSDKSVQETVSAKDASEALRRIAARYDVTQITPRQLARMLDELRETRALSEDDLQQLGQVLFDLHEEGIDLDDTVDLVRFYTKKLDELQDILDAHGSTEEAFRQIAPTLAGLQKRLDWISRLALLHSAPDSAAVNVLT